MADIMLPYNGATRAVLANNTDLDDAINPGIYVISSSNTYTHSPVAFGMLEVTSSSTTSNYRTQKISSYDEGNWTRYKYGSNGWSSWSRELEATIESPTYSNGILHYAYNVAPIGITVISPRNFSTSDMPDASFAYSTAIILKRSNGAISVTLISDSNNCPIATNAYSNNNSAWLGWKFQGSAYISSETNFYSTLASVDTYVPFTFYLGSTATAAIFGITVNSSYGYGMYYSATAFDGILVSANETYQFRINPSTHAVITFNRLSREITNISASSASSHSFTIPNSYRGVLYAITSDSTYCGEWIIFANTSGGVTMVEVKGASNITWSKTTNTITATYTSAHSIRYGFITLNGGEPSLITS